MESKKLQKNIPEGWRATKLSSIGVFSKGAGISKEQLSESGHNAVRYGELYTRYDFHIRKIYSRIPSIIIPLTRKINYGDILFAGSGETNDEIGKSAVYLLREDGYAGGDIIIFSPKNANSLFLSYFLNIGEARKKLRELGQGQSVVHIYKSDIEKLEMHLPSLSEQNRIVAVLETWDRAIEKLKEKIELKKQVKKGLMQQLLTGKKRLPGFKDKWETVKLGDVSFIERGDAFTKKNIIHGSIPVIAGGQQPAYYHNESNRDGETITISGSGAYAGYVDFYNQPIFVSDGMSIQERTLNIAFIYYFLKLNQEYIYSLQTGGAQPHVYPKDLQRLKLDIPKLKEEQVAIANILDAADEEIRRLESKSSLLQDQKKYLLNNLITGSIRTPEKMKIKLLK